MPSRLKFNFYCLQVTFCAVIIWVVIANIILYFVFPTDEPKNFQKPPSGSSRKTDEGLEFTTLSGVLHRFLTHFKEFRFDNDLVLIQPRLLEQASASSFLWSEFSKETQRILTFVLKADEVVHCSDKNFHFQGLAEKLDAHYFCKTGHLLFATSAALFHVAFLKKQQLSQVSAYYVSFSQLLDSSSEEKLFTVGINTNSPLLFLNDLLAFDYRLISSKLASIDHVDIQVPENIPEFLDALPKSKFVSCKSGFFDKYPKMDELRKTSEAIAFRRRARRILASASRALDELNLSYWLSSGTALGNTILSTVHLEMGILMKEPLLF